MASRTSSQPQAEPGQTSENVGDILRAGVEAAERDEGLDLTTDEAQHYYETGELPERVQRAGEIWAESWRASRG